MKCERCKREEEICEKCGRPIYPNIWNQEQPWVKPFVPYCGGTTNDKDDNIMNCKNGE